MAQTYRPQRGGRGGKTIADYESSTSAIAVLAAARGRPPNVLTQPVGPFTEITIVLAVNTLELDAACATTHAPTLRSDAEADTLCDSFVEVDTGNRRGRRTRRQCHRCRDHNRDRNACLLQPMSLCMHSPSP
ncbi:hypothetical protein [Rathayibacter soli]|uniref:hypothetical protein n=1 Tax=Rathayibacter soli TaxID=3144168 RepID=UPI0027E534A6|nr:hypothetical protein [Glaciibacter superstes]